MPKSPSSVRSGKSSKQAKTKPPVPASTESLASTRLATPDEMEGYCQGFRDPDADLVVVSSDGVKFRLHRHSLKDLRRVNVLECARRPALS